MKIHTTEIMEIIWRWKLFSDELLKEINKGEIELPSFLGRKFENLRLVTRDMTKRDIENFMDGKGEK